MAAQGERRNDCVVTTGSLLHKGTPWCIAHGLPAGHAAPQEGDVGADPADRTLPSDGEEQYAGAIRGHGGGGTARTARVLAAVGQLHEHGRTGPYAEQARRELAELAAQQWATAQPVNQPLLLPMAAACGTCGAPVHRFVQLPTGWCQVSEWRHNTPDATHPVRTVAFPDKD